MTDSDTTTDGTERNETVDRDKLPHEVYASHTNFVTVGMKTTTAQRLVGWLREYAEFSEVAGATKTAEHARAVSDLLASEVDEKPVCSNCGETLGEDWRHRDKHAKKAGEHPADCPNCGENPLPPVGGESA
jgi:hypothetical protein